MRRREPRSPVVLRGRGDRVVAERCRVADTALLRLVGLLGRRTLPAGDALLLPRTGSIHMFFMRIAIDAVFLDRDDVVVKVVAGLRPWRVAAARRARSVVELAAGEAGARGVAIGDRLRTEAAEALG